jgi:hypothetical protein
LRGGGFLLEHVRKLHEPYYTFCNQLIVLLLADYVVIL